MFQEFRRSLIASLFRPMEQSSPTSSSYSNTSTCNEVPSTSNSHGSQQAATPFKHPFFAPMINSINSVDSIGTIPAAIATVPPYANRAHQSSSTEQPASNLGQENCLWSGGLCVEWHFSCFGMKGKQNHQWKLLHGLRFCPGYE